ncbi:aminoglycoside phosphotransferase family protein [Alicyclobacillus mali]|uniref:Aminoglycoside phosphotransferase family protein n=1 Tax=Alicyclobacillus mali (ex Roth et al. 2021) TaxID=1123961 RepID=A0ABS0F6D7_9BACL|nr:aminoglycoside phosphotransferase family protein [Alicyclobacillus mali (ex Roth et al. 2021)]MBF8378865.1 aminoglycoside phosphotransferase family protein [Alicyclobacillus mali (ex Roth et al. 2021)]MCL6489226.1 aminoglycoside phosphotransferase family protein [Alicyclobacillus mali (ex Roth et al. 2021)]
MDAGEMADLVRRAYGIVPDAIVQKRTVWGIVAGASRYILKRARPQDCEERLRALADVLRHYPGVGVAAAMPLATRTGTMRASDGRGGWFYLQPWLEGRHVDVRDESERLAVTRALARAQRAAPPGGLDSALAAATLRDKWRAKLQLLERLKGMPVEAEIADSLNRIAARARAVYASYLDGTRPLAFCHRDLAPHNVLVGPGGSVMFIDFDHAGYDDPFADPIQWVSHVAYLVPLCQSAYRRLWLTYAQAAELGDEELVSLVRLGAWPDIALRALAEAFRGGEPERRVWRLRYAVRREEERARLHDAWLRELDA